MFETVQQNSRLDLLKRFISLLISAAVHLFAILILVVLPLIYFNILPELDLVTFLIAAPPPPAPIPPPVPPPPSGQNSAIAREVAITNISIPPITIPKGIPEPSPKDLEVSTSYALPGMFGVSPGSIQGATPGPGLASLLGPIVAPLSPPPPPKPIRAQARKAGGVVLDGMVVKRVEPAYPPLARAARVSGTVILQVHIDEEGSVEAVEVLSGHPLLVGAASEAVRQWKYSPTLLNGEPVPVIGTVTVIFNLR